MNSLHDISSDSLTSDCSTVIDQYCEYWRYVLSILYGSESYARTLIIYSELCSRDDNAPVSVIEPIPRTKQYGVGYNRTRTQYRTIPSSIQPSHVNAVVQPSHVNRIPLIDLSNQINTPLLGDEHTIPNTFSTVLIHTDNINTSINNTISSNASESTPHRIQDLDTRFARFRCVYPAVVYDGDGRFFFTGYPALDPGIKHTDREYMCAYPSCTQLPQNNRNRVHKYTHHPTGNQSNILYDCRYCNLKLTFNQRLRHNRDEHSDVHKPSKPGNGSLSSNPSTDNSDVAVPDNNVGQSEILPDNYNEVYTTADMDTHLVPTRHGITPLVPIKRNARPLIVVKFIKLDYWCNVNKSLMQWRPLQCRGKSRNINCSCQHAGNCRGSTQCTCNGVHQPCVIYCNGYKLRWVYSSDLLYLAAIPAYRCDLCKCSGGAFTSNYEVSPDINLNIIPDITAHGGKLGERVQYLEREFYIDCMIRYSYQFNATSLSQQICGKWKRNYLSRSIVYDTDIKNNCTDPGIDDKVSGYYYGFKMDDIKRTEFYSIYRTELQTLCTNISFTSEYIADLFHVSYAPNELIHYMKSMYEIVYQHGTEHLIHDHTFKMTRSQHIHNPDSRQNQNVSTRLCVTAMLSTVMCLDTGLILACKQVPNTKVHSVVQSLQPYIEYQRTLPPGTGKRIKSIGVDNARTQQRFMSMGLYSLLLPYNQNDIHDIFGKQAADIRKLPQYQTDSQWYQWLHSDSNTNKANNTIQFTEDLWHLKERIKTKGVWKYHPAAHMLFKSLTELFNKIKRSEFNSAAELSAAFTEFYYEYALPPPPSTMISQPHNDISIDNYTPCSCNTCTTIPPYDNEICSNDITPRKRRPTQPLLPTKHTKLKKLPRKCNTSPDITTGDMDMTTGEYTVSNVTDMKWCCNRQNWVFLVYWTNWNGDPTWEPFTSLSDPTNGQCSKLTEYFGSLPRSRQPVLNKSGRTAVDLIMKNMDYTYNIIQIRRENTELSRNSGTNLCEAWHSKLNGTMMKKGTHSSR